MFHTCYKFQFSDTKSDQGKRDQEWYVLPSTMVSSKST